MKNLSRLVSEYGLAPVQAALPYMESVFWLHHEGGLTFQEICERYEITYERALLAAECAVALDVVGRRWHKQFG